MAQGVPGRLRSRIFLTFRHYKGGRSSAKRTGRRYHRRNPWYSLSEAESTSGHMVLSGVPRKKSSVTPPGIDPGIFRLVAQRLNHYAKPGPLKFGTSTKTQRRPPILFKTWQKWQNFTWRRGMFMCSWPWFVFVTERQGSLWGTNCGGWLSCSWTQQSRMNECKSR